jgi:hypothetical protein
MKFNSRKYLKVLLAFMGGLGIGGYFFVAQIHDFLSPNSPIEAQILVIEGWLPDDALKKAAELIVSNHYELIITTGGPLDHGLFLSEYKTYANLARATLVKLANRHDIEAVASPEVQKDRTYASALAFKKWLQDNRIRLNNVNVVSQEAHGRRSRYLFQKALGNDYSVGIISIADSDYDADRWWASSEGFKTVVEETIAYIYTLLVFPFVDG